MWQIEITVAYAYQEKFINPWYVAYLSTPISPRCSLFCLIKSHYLQYPYYSGLQRVYCVARLNSYLNLLRVIILIPALASATVFLLLTDEQAPSLKLAEGSGLRPLADPRTGRGPLPKAAVRGRSPPFMVTSTREVIGVLFQNLPAL